MASEAELCNLALMRIGEDATIVNLETDQSPNAKKCQLAYPIVRDALQRAYWWHFNKLYADLAQVETDPVPHWGYSYMYPNGCLLARYILNPADPDNKGEPIPFEIVADGANGRLIYTNESPATLVFTTRIVTVGTFDPLFYDALAWALAVELSLAITKDQRIRRDTLLGFQLSIARAAGVALSEGWVERYQPGAYERARG